MQIKRRRRAVRASVAIGAAISTLCLWAVGQTPAHAAVAQVTQGVPAPYVTPANSSDPHTKPCVHNGTAGFCLFTSQDLRQGSAVYPSNQTNFYPMSETFGYFSTDGINWSAPTVLMRESTYQSQGWVQSSVNGAAFSPLHLWAPSAQQGSDGNWYLYVPDISDQTNPSGSSFIGVSKSTTGDPMGPYTPIGRVNIPSNNNALSNPKITVNPNIPGYASDPDVVDSTSGQSRTPYLAYNDGDFSTCGGVSIAPLNTDMMTINTTALVHPILDNIPSTWGAPTCTDVFGRTHLYMEGPHIYNTTLGGAAGSWPAGVPGPYLMVVPIKPNAVPPECALNVQGQPNSANELVAYFTATTPRGNPGANNSFHWNYGGVLMCGSGSSEFTDQGSIMPIASHGHTALILVYHDGPGQDSTGHNRTLHAECLLWSAGDTHGGGSGPGFNGDIAQSIRTAGTQFTDSGAESNCLTNFDDTSFALRSPATTTNPPMFMSGNGPVTADRFDVGPWEKFRVLLNGATQPATFADNGKPNTNGVNILSEVANQFVATSGANSCLNANGSGGTLFDFNLQYSGGLGGTFFVSEQTGNGEKSTASAQVCDQGDAATPWFVYHY